ncbi:hypothetical protein TrLO_g1767 [Triparma laevis f. longispina]|uniref:Uncharacterized protein n=1 Tax=Triparma laevis f. longispina TaxID=1714387 RepID=A0A9W7C6L2_9STRA|nr:hypothetical protein TrLO_g1767 [Triparma laevis f. longispina]
MGRSLFTCSVPTAARFNTTFAHICIHNNVIEMKPTGEQYTGEEFKALDQMRAKVCEQMKGMSPNMIMGCKEKWTRGEDLQTDRAYVIRYRGQPWLVVPNHGGGACTTRLSGLELIRNRRVGLTPRLLPTEVYQNCGRIFFRTNRMDCSLNRLRWFY